MCMCMHACVRACKRQDPPAADHGAVDSSGTTRRRGLAVTSLECFYNLHNGNGNEECLKPWDWCTLHNGNGEMLHNGNGKTLHNGNGKTLYNGNGKTLYNGNGGMLHITPTSCVEKSSNGLCPSDHTSYINIPKLHTSLFVVYLR